MKASTREFLDAGLIAMVITLTVGSIIGIAIWINVDGDRREARYAAWEAEAMATKTYRDAWWPTRCHRFYVAGTQYMHPLFLCNDGNVYAYEDMPTGEEK